MVFVGVELDVLRVARHEPQDARDVVHALAWIRSAELELDLEPFLLLRCGHSPAAT